MSKHFLLLSSHQPRSISSYFNNRQLILGIFILISAILALTISEYTHNTLAFFNERETLQWVVRSEHHSIPFFNFSLTTPIFPAEVMNFAAWLNGTSSRMFLFTYPGGWVPSATLFTVFGLHGLELPPNLRVKVALIFIIIALGFWNLVGLKMAQNYLEKEL